MRIPRLLAAPLAAAGLASVWYTWTTGWICPTGGTGPCSHGYMSVTASLLFVGGVALALFGAVLATGRPRSPVAWAGTAALIAGAILVMMWVLWIGIAAIAAGIVLIAVGDRRRPP